MVNKIKIPLRVIDKEHEIARVKTWKIPEIDKKQVELFLRELNLGKITGNQISAGTLNFYITNLKIALEFFNKPVSKLIPKDTEKLCESLLKNELRYSIKRKNSEGKKVKEHHNYSETGKIKIKNTLIKFLDWKLKDKANSYTKILEVKPRLKEPTVDYMTEVQAEKLYKSCATNEERFFTAVLYDTGARAEEFHNIRFEDIELPKKDANFVKITLKEEYSKTKGRTVGLYWKYSLSAVRDYLDERIREGIQPDEPVFKKKYKTMRKWLNDFGKKVLGRHVYYHLYRHSSALLYADKLNRQQLCIRYGWAFRSPMPDRYINRKALGEKEVDEKFEKTAIEDLKVELEQFRHRDRLKDEEMKDLKLQVKELALYLKENLTKAKNDLDEVKIIEVVPEEIKSEIKIISS